MAPLRTVPKELLIIDQAPLFEEALGACQLSYQSLERIRAELHRYERDDLPAYERWFHANFGRYLTETREFEALLRQKEAQLASARNEHWARFFDSTPFGTYAEPTLGRESAGRSRCRPAYDEENEAYAEDEEAGDAEAEAEGFSEEDYRYEDEESRFFDDEELHDYDEDDESVRRFEEAMRRGSDWRSWQYRSRFRTEGEDHGSGSRRTGQESGPPGGQDPRAHSAPGAQEVTDRIRQRYRILVRRLHPDLNSALSPEEISLWHRVQLAYRNKDLEQLDLLLALSDAFTGNVSASTSLHQLRNVTREFERLVAPLKRKLHEARQHRAWNFSRLSNRSQLHDRVEDEVREGLRDLRRRLWQLDSQIQRFSPRRDGPSRRASSEKRTGF